MALEMGAAVEARQDGDNYGDLRKGMAIEVHLKSGGKTRWIKGKILYARFNGTFDIQLAGGKQENGVEGRLIRKIARDDVKDTREVEDVI